MVPTWEHTLIVDTNLHVFIFNIELRQNVWRGRSRFQVSSCRGWAQEWWGGVIQNQQQEDSISSPMQSFQSLYSSQSSEEGIKEPQMNPYVSPPQTTVTIHFEDTLADNNCSWFNLIYESLLTEGKTGNLTDLAIGMVLAGKPPAWLPVICKRLNHLIISSEAFQKMKRIEYSAWLRARKLRVGKGKG